MIKNKINNSKEKLKAEKEELKKEVSNKLTALITAAFGLVAALAWNDTIKTLFVTLFGTADNLWAMLVYALVVTLIAVFVTIKLPKWLSK
jgi:membrane protein YdbS with pleckstrin-like domain